MTTYYGPRSTRFGGTPPPTWRSCRADSPDGRYLCTQRIPRGHQTHAGDHVAEGRADGEPDSVIATWTK